MKYLFILLVTFTTSSLANDLCLRLADGDIFAQDGKNTYLGRINNQYLRNSVFNEIGPHGNEYNPKSIWSDVGTFGSAYSSYSPFNTLSLFPPKITRKGEILGYLTVNKNLEGAVSPHDLKKCKFVLN